jgi:hypothetical protein
MRWRQVALARGWSLDQIPQLRKGLRGFINRHLWCLKSRLRSSSYGAAGPALARRGSLHWGSGPAEPKLRSSEGWRPGLDLNQDKERLHGSCVDAFRHRAASTIADPDAISHA